MVGLPDDVNADVMTDDTSDIYDGLLSDGEEAEQGMLCRRWWGYHSSWWAPALPASAAWRRQRS